MLICIYRILMHERRSSMINAREMEETLNHFSLDFGGTKDKVCISSSFPKCHSVTQTTKLKKKKRLKWSFADIYG